MNNTLTPEQLDHKLEKYDFEMFSRRGNNACRSAVKKIFKTIRGKKRLTEDDVQNLVVDTLKKIQVKYPEVWDTEPRGSIVHLTELCCEEVGYDFDVY